MMIKKVLGTIGSRLLSALVSLIIIIITSKQLGAEAMGTISLVILGITIVQMVNNFVGGSALIYLIPRFEVYKLFIPSYIWAFFTAIVCSYLLKILYLIPDGYFIHIFFLSLIQSLSSVNLNILLGKEKIKQFNIITTAQIILLIAVLIFMIFQQNNKNVYAYIIALYISYLFGLFLSMIAAFRLFHFSNLKNLKEVLYNILRFGTYVQIANIIQLFNYRFSYFLVENFIGRAALGIYSVGVQLSEGLWLTGKSMAIVQYSKISNTDDKEYAKKITLLFGKVSFLVTFFLLIILILIPHSFFSVIFGKDFSELPVVILSLSSGILFLSLSFSLSHYFSGIGKHYHNSISSSIGLVFTIALGYILIPQYKLVGAGITASTAYLSILVYQIFFFIKISGAKTKDIFLSVKDIQLFLYEFKNIFKKNNLKSS
ncbi:MAG: oligosaccharide flippase family protein [Bacteroidetes bacterium]|nr:oligosaccharide flippase family protein [Bacteroidota bacterium]